MGVFVRICTIVWADSHAQSPLRERHLGIKVGRVRRGKIAAHLRLSVASDDNNAVVRRFRAHPTRFETWIAEEAQIHIYSVSEDTLLFDCAFANHFTNGAFYVLYCCRCADDAGLDPGGADVKQAILKLFHGSSSDLLSLLESVEPQDIYSWSETDIPTLDRWSVDRAGWIGDAAHPFLACKSRLLQTYC